MKKLIVILMVMASGPAVHARCEIQALNEIFRIYKKECNGFGRKSKNCGLEEQKKSAGNITWKAVCFYSGEPDYNDGATAYLTFDLGNCRLKQTRLEECYTD